MSFIRFISPSFVDFLSNRWDNPAVECQLRQLFCGDYIRCNCRCARDEPVDIALALSTNLLENHQSVYSIFEAIFLHNWRWNNVTEILLLWFRLGFDGGLNLENMLLELFCLEKPLTMLMLHTGENWMPNGSDKSRLLTKSHQTRLAIYSIPSWKCKLIL